MINLQAIISAVEKLAPELAAALGGPVGLVISTLLSNFFGVHPENLASTIQADPNSEFKLKQFVLQHTEELAQLASADYATEVKDRINAREMDKDDKHFWFLALLSFVFVLGFFVFISMLLSKYFADTQTAHQVFDMLSNALFVVLTYWLGSSHKSNRT